METSQIIQSVITVLSSGAIVLILRELIKSQQTQINSMRSNIDSMKSYMDIFKVEEIEKFVEVVRKNAALDARAVAFESTKEYIESDEAKRFLKSVIESHPIMDQYDELFQGLCDYLSLLPEVQREDVIKTVFPRNASDLRTAFDNMNQEDRLHLKDRQEIILAALEALRQPEGGTESGPDSGQSEK